MSKSEVVSTGLWNCPTKSWDEASLELLARGKEEVAQLHEMLGEVQCRGRLDIFIFPGVLWILAR